MIRPRSLLALWGWLVVRTLLRRRWLQLLLLRSESGGWRVSPAFRATWADLVARMPLAGLRPLASSVEEWDARCGELLALLRRCALVVGRGLGACEPPISLVTGLQPAVPSRPCWGAYLFSSKVSVACGQQLDWRGVRHTRELCGDADPCGHLRESYAPLISIKSTSDLDRHHMPWGYLEHKCRHRECTAPMPI